MALKEFIVKLRSTVYVEADIVVHASDEDEAEIVVEHRLEKDKLDLKALTWKLPQNIEDFEDVEVMSVSTPPEPEPPGLEEPNH